MAEGEGGGHYRTESGGGVYGDKEEQRGGAHSWAQRMNLLHDLAILNRTVLFRLLACVVVIAGMTLEGVQMLMAYYTDDILHFQQKQQSLLLTVVGIRDIVGQGILLQPLS